MVNADVRIEFAVTFEDYRAAMLAYWAAERRAGAPPRAGWLGWALFALVAGAALAACLYAARDAYSPAILSAPSAEAVRFVQYVAPWLLWSAVSATALVEARKGRWWAVTYLGVVGVVGAALGGLAWYWAGHAERLLAVDRIFPLSGWMAVGWLWGVVVKRLLAGARLRSTWARTYQLQGPRAVILNDEFMSEEDAHSLTRHRWEVIKTWSETPEVFVAYAVDRTWCIIPKRAFGTAEQVEWFRDLLARKTRPKGAVDRPGFPVGVAADGPVNMADDETP